MPRDANGNYTVPVTFTPNTLARASEVNDDFSDAGDALTDSLSRSGKGAMLAPMKAVDGTVLLPGIAFAAQPNTGLYRAASSEVRMSINGVDLRVSTTAGELLNGSFTIAQSTGQSRNVRYDVDGVLRAAHGFNTDGSWSLKRYSVSGVFQDNILHFTSAGFTSMQGVYNNTTGLAANVTVGSDGALVRSVSSLRYKENVEDYVPVGFDDLRPVTFTSKGDPSGTRFAGLIAEEVDEAGLTELVVYDGEGRPEALQYPNFVAVLIYEVQRLKARVAALEGG